MAVKKRKWKPTPTMVKFLKNLAAGRPANYGMAPGRSTAGGLNGTRHALRREGLLQLGDQLTEAGEKFAAELE